MLCLVVALDLGEPASFAAHFLGHGIDVGLIDAVTILVQVLGRCLPGHWHRRARNLPDSLEHKVWLGLEFPNGTLAAHDQGQNRRLTDLNEQSRAFNDKKITAHHAIIPTLNAAVRITDMNPQERLLYDLIRRRYLAQFLGVFKYQETRITGQCEGEVFSATGRVPLVPGWKRAYVDMLQTAPAKPSRSKALDNSEEDEGPPKDLALPAVQIGQQIINRRADVVKTQTKPPKRYTEGTLVAAMESIDKEIEDPRLKKVMQNKEKAGIGTDATRGATLEGLFKRGYFDKAGKNIVPTARGEQLIGIVEQVVPHMADPVLTALWEDHLAKVENGQIPLETFEAQLGVWLKAQIEKIRQLAAANPQSVAFGGPHGHGGGVAAPASEKRHQGTVKPLQKPSQPTTGGQAGVHSCPSCGKPMRLRSGSSGAFWGCSGYPACRTTLPDDGGKPGIKGSSQKTDNKAR